MYQVVVLSHRGLRRVTSELVATLGWPAGWSSLHAAGTFCMLPDGTARLQAENGTGNLAP
jgi:hypothetical protein